MPARLSLCLVETRTSAMLSGCIGFGLCQELRLMLAGPSFNQFLEPWTFEHEVELVQREIDTMVGDAALRKIIGADTLRPVTRPDLAASLRGALGVEPLPLPLI